MTEREAIQTFSSTTETATVGWQHENGETGTTPILPVTASRSGGSSATRWGIALVVVALVIGLTAAAFFVLGGREDPDAFAYVPADSAMVLEIRPELPGDQRGRLGNLLSNFPGFADQATLDEKIDEALARLVADVSDGDVDYSTDVKPWLSGPVVLALLEAPEASAAGNESRFVAILNPDASVSCASIGYEGTLTEQYRDRDLLIRDEPGMGRTACVDTDGLVIGGDVDSVKVALDTKAGGRDITGSATFLAARAAFEGDRVAFGYVDVKALAGTMRAVRPDVPGLGFATDGQSPEWMAFIVRLENDALVADAAMPNTIDSASPAPARTFPPDRISVIAPHLPASTVAVLEGHGLGIMVLNALDAARSDPETAQQVRELEQAAALLGGLEGLVGWMGDASIVITRDGTQMGAGLVVETTDAAMAEARLDQLKSLIALLGGGAGISVEEVAYGSARITVIDLGALAGEIDPGDLPGGIADDPVLAYALADGLFVLGIGVDFVKAVLDAAPGSSLADQAAFQRAVELAGATNSGQAFVDVGALLALVETEMDPADAARYRTEVKPYMDPIEAAAVTARFAGDLIRVTFVITVR